MSSTKLILEISLQNLVFTTREMAIFDASDNGDFTSSEEVCSYSRRSGLPPRYTPFIIYELISSDSFCTANIVDCDISVGNFNT